MRYYKSEHPILSYQGPSTKIAVLGSVLLIISAICFVIRFSLSSLEKILVFESIMELLFLCEVNLFVAGIFLIISSVVVYCLLPDSTKIKIMIKKGLFAYQYGNPLHLKNGERLPKIRCKNIGLGLFEVTITATANTVEDIQKVSTNISSSLNKKRFLQYAVTQVDVDIAFNEVKFFVENVMIDKSLYIHSIEELQSKDPTRLIVQKGTCIDLTSSGSILVAGKTRSGKTTGIIALLLQILLAGRDRYGSEVIIIDPKQAELSRLPHVFTLDEDGEAREILSALQYFVDTIVKRQKILNDLSEQKGDAVHWWDVEGFRASFLFVDEYVSVRTMFPKRADKTDTNYSLSAFDGLIKRIVTMGASAGCYAIISIAEASVDEGGIPAMIRSACTTKVLFKPTLVEGRFLWDGNKLKDFPEGRVYNAGECWFSSTDGIHDNVSFVHFPVMNFPIYRALGELLQAYYK